MTYSFKDKLRHYFTHDNCIGKLTSMPTRPIIITTLKNLKSIIYLSLLLL